VCIYIYTHTYIYIPIYIYIYMRLRVCYAMVASAHKPNVAARSLNLSSVSSV
jgi:hypothetical protein